MTIIVCIVPLGTFPASTNCLHHMGEDMIYSSVHSLQGLPALLMKSSHELGPELEELHRKSTPWDDGSKMG